MNVFDLDNQQGKINIDSNFIQIESDSIFRRSIFPIFVKNSDGFTFIGTGFIISENGLICTAGHVWREIQRLDREHVKSERQDSNWKDGIYALYLPDANSDAGVAGMVLAVNRLYAHPDLDLGLGWLSVPVEPESGRLLPLPRFRLDLRAPCVGEELIAIGYHGMKGTLNDMDIANFNSELSLSNGKVHEVHLQKRDSSMLKFPCFRVDSRYDHGMSGSPILNNNGFVCGVVCSSFGDPESMEFTSYGALLWPLMGYHVDTSFYEGIWSERLHIHELILRDIVSVSGLENVSVCDKGDETSEVSYSEVPVFSKSIL